MGSLPYKATSGPEASPNGRAGEQSERASGQQLQVARPNQTWTEANKARRRGRRIRIGSPSSALHSCCVAVLVTRATTRAAPSFRCPHLSRSETLCLFAPSDADPRLASPSQASLVQPLRTAHACPSHFALHHTATPRLA